MKKDHEFSLFYMCEPGRLEWQSLCLASSVLALCTSDYRMYAYCSREKLPNLREPTVRFHESHNIPIIPIDTAGVFDRKYLVGSKIVASAQTRPSAFSVLLDTDTMLVSNLDFSSIALPNCVAAFPSVTKALGYSVENWKHVYAKFGLNVPKRRFKFDYV